MQAFQVVKYHFGRRLHMVKDYVMGLDFLSVTNPAKLGFDEKQIHRGSPSQDIELRFVLQDLRINPAAPVLDIGCAKGHAIRIFLNAGFQTVDGLEISSTYCSVARKNFKKLNRDVVVYNQDARLFNQYNKYCVYYMYNPFSFQIMERVLTLINQQKSEATLIYNNPQHHNIVLKNGFVLTKRYPNIWGTGINVYKINA